MSLPENRGTDPLPRTQEAWRRFNQTFAVVLAGAFGILFFLIYLIDPWGVVPFALPMDRPLVDIKQRHLYPMVIRSGRYDSVIIGNSTIRLLDPDDLDDKLNAGFANLAMNDGRAFEQWRLADLYLRELGPPRNIIVGLDGTWCHPEADARENRITGRGFPEWIYDENPWNDLLHVFNVRTVEFAGRVIVTKAGLRPKRLGDNGFAVFVPPENDYDPEKAAAHIWGDGPRSITPVVPAVTLTQEERRSLSFPAHKWLSDLMNRTDGATRFILLWAPVHIRSQPVPGSHAAAVEEACKSRIDALALDADAVVIDWRRHSAVTSVDLNYWDALHYRIPIAKRIAGCIIDTVSGGAVETGTPWRVRIAPQ
ncbi:MAG: hypothetical protein AAGF59_15475 [Pseudomonadota bacterium]